MSFVMNKWNTLSQATEVLGKIFKRTAIIFLCGFLLYWFPFCYLIIPKIWSLTPYTHSHTWSAAKNCACLLYRITINLLFQTGNCYKYIYFHSPVILGFDVMGW